MVLEPEQGCTNGRHTVPERHTFCLTNEWPHHVLTTYLRQHPSRHVTTTWWPSATHYVKEGAIPIYSRVNCWLLPNNRRPMSIAINNQLNTTKQLLHQPWIHGIHWLVCESLHPMVTLHIYGPHFHFIHFALSQVGSSLLSIHFHFKIEVSWKAHTVRLGCFNVFF